MTRTATISAEQTRRSPLSMVQRYLPSNYTAEAQSDGSVRITGTDRAGWNMEYVIDRLASGLIYAKEDRAD